jgi:aminoglycoside phosphotransferase (APT) family kinase protein
VSPAADVVVTVELVASLLRVQHADLASLPLAPFAHGWDNEVFRLGDELLVRMPRRATAAALIEHELSWLPAIAAHCTLPVPVPVRRGVPGDGYPYPWSVVPHLAGRAVGEALLDNAAARTLAAFVRGLHVTAPANAPRNPLRGTPLGDRQARFDTALATLGDRVDQPRLREAWARCLATAAWSAPPVWLHGDLHPLNVLTDGTQLCGVIDFGDLGAGDPAVDLAIAYFGFASHERAVFLDETGADPDTLERGRGWALALGAVFAASDDPVLSRLGMRALTSAVA